MIVRVFSGQILRLFFIVCTLTANVFLLFTRNRLQRILRHTKVYDWGYVSTKVNPADKLTRGMSASALVKDSLRFAGPQFLLLTPDKWPVGLTLKPTKSVYRCYDQPSNEQLDSSTGQNFCSSMAIVNVCCSSKQKVDISHPTCQLIMYFFFLSLKVSGLLVA